MKTLMTLTSKRDLAITGLLFLFFFLVVAVFQILKPLKSGLFVEYYGARMELYAKLVNVLIAALGVWAFTSLYNRLHRRRFMYMLGGAFVCSFIGLAFLLKDDPGTFAIWAFYLVGDLEVTMMVATFWAYLTDLSQGPDAQKLFGLIGGGGVLGGWAGVSIAKFLLAAIGTEGLLLLAAGLMGGVILVIAATELLTADSQTFKPNMKAHAAQNGERLTHDWKTEAFEGARLVLRSRYLLGIAGIMGSYEIASQLMDYQFKLAAQDISGVQATQAFITDVYLYASLLAVFTQFFLVGVLMRKFGLGVTLLILPVAIIGGSFGFLAMPTLAVVSVLVVLDNGLNYSVLQTGRESLYLATSPDEKYKGRAFISMFVQRMAKGLSILTVILLGMGEVTAQLLSLLIIGILGVMVLLSIKAGRHYAHTISRIAAPASAARNLASATPRLSSQAWMPSV